MKLSARFEKALIYAARHHNLQERKGSGVPYIAHLISVAGLALEYGADLFRCALSLRPTNFTMPSAY